MHADESFLGWGYVVITCVITAPCISRTRMRKGDQTRRGDETESDINESHVWHLIGAYFAKYGVVRHQIESFDYFMTSSLPHIVSESSNIVVRSENDSEVHTVTMCNVSVQRPLHQEADGYERIVNPTMARLRSLTYASNVLVDIVHDICKNGVHVERRVFREILLARIPIMVGSSYCTTYQSDRNDECRLDQGGYFIINGIEKCLLAQEKLHTNTAYIFAAKQPSKYLLNCEIRSCHEQKMRSTSTLYLHISLTKQGAIPEIVAELPFIDMTLPILALFKLIGVETKDEVRRLIIGDQDDESSRQLCGILDNDTTCNMTHDEIVDWIGREGTKEPTKERRIKYLQHIVANEVLPHMGLTMQQSVLRAKACFLGFMVRKLVNAYNGTIQCDDRDHYANKRIDTAGMLMSLLFRQVYRMVMKTLHINLHRLMESNKLCFTNISELINNKKITGQFKYAFSTGNWGMQRGNAAQTGVAQMMSRMTPVSALANLRRINTPINREGKAPKPRQLHYTSWGLVCPVETPEGTSCGLVKNLAMMTHVRIGSSSKYVCDVLRRIEEVELTHILDCDDHTRANGVPILVNGSLFMYTKHADDVRTLLVTLRQMRRDQLIPFDTSLSYVDQTVCIDCDPGCLMRPLIVADRVDDIIALMHASPSYEHLWEFMLRRGVVEYVDKQEEMDLEVGMWMYDRSKKYTHYELHPSMINGLCAALIPFPDHNQSPRNTYQSAMGKQAVGIPGLNYNIRMDTVSHVLSIPQRPLVTTRIDDILHTSDAPTGVNVIVAIMCWTGFNQEDSLIVNRQAIERGIFRTVKYQCYKDEERTNGADAEKFENPSLLSECIGLRFGCYDKLQPDGFPEIGTTIGTGDVIIGKTMTTTELGEGNRRSVKRDRSVIVKHGDNMIVDAILMSRNRDGSNLTKVRTRTTRAPIIGDKLSSRHGQKGVIGAVLDAVNMPFTSNGLIPDLIVNPHAIPSRMTIGQLMECLLGKLCAYKGKHGDATPFRGASIQQIGEELQEMGLDPLGEEKMFNGMTGEELPAKVFIGPVYYQRLRHMVSDKYHSRSRGTVQILTRQPVEGRAREGGLRFGEMERDCIISHGAANVLSERLFEQSDPFVSSVCNKCGFLAQPGAEKTMFRNRKPYCRLCESGEFTHDVRMPYAFKLLIHELLAMKIAIRLRLKCSEQGEPFDKPPCSLKPNNITLVCSMSCDGEGHP